MPYGFIVLFASIALVAYFDFATKASWITKAVVSGLFIFCFVSFFGWITFNSLINLFLLAGLSSFIIFYRTWQQAHSRKQDFFAP